MSDFIKVSDPVVAMQLASTGFTYMKEECNGKLYYVFCATPELLSVMNMKFENTDFMRNNRLNF